MTYNVIVRTKLNTPKKKKKKGEDSCLIRKPVTS